MKNFVCCVGTSLLLCGSVYGAEPPAAIPPKAATNEAPVSTEIESFAITEQKRRTPTVANLYTIRCWQHGRLLFSESNLSEPVVMSMPGKVASFKRASPANDPLGAEAVQVLEISDAICLLTNRR